MTTAIILMSAMQRHFGSTVICERCGATVDTAPDKCQLTDSSQTCPGVDTITDHMRAVVTAASEAPPVTA